METRSKSQCYLRPRGEEGARPLALLLTHQSFQTHPPQGEVKATWVQWVRAMQLALVLLLFPNKLLPCSSGWPQTHRCPISISQV